MSLIIDMLKNLEQRQNANPIPPLIMLADQTAPQRRTLNIKLLAGGISTGLFLLIVIFLVAHKQTTGVLASLPPEKTVVKKILAEKVVETEILNPTIISGVSIESTPNTTQASFLLSKDTLYHFTSNEANHTLTLIIENTSLHSDLPKLAGDNDAIQNIIAIPVNGNMKFVFSLQAGVILKSANIVHNNPRPELNLTFNHPTLAENETISVAHSVKSPAVENLVIEQYQHALKLAGSGQQNAAIKQLNKILSYYPDYADARVALAALSLENGKTAFAQKVIDDGLVLAPDYLPLIELKARLLTAQGKLQEALMALDSEQPAISDAPSYHALRAALYNRLNDFQLAAEVYKKLLAIYPHNGSWWFGLGISLDNSGKKRDAVYAYTKAATEGRLDLPATAYLQNRLQTLRKQTND